MWLLLAVWQCHSVTRSEQGLGLRQGQCLLIFAQLIRKRYGQAHYQRTATATATTFRSYSGAHNRCAARACTLGCHLCVCVCVLPDSEAWQRNRNGINEPYQQCDVDAAAVHAHLLASLHPATCSAPYPMATPAQHIVCVCGSGKGAHRFKTDKTASRLPALGIPNLTHVAHCNCKCLSFRHAAPN